MKVNLTVVAQGTYATFVDGKVETTVRLPNGTKRVAVDLDDLADAAQLKAENEIRRVARLRAAAKAYREDAQS